ncbi:diacylglycerol O-acyltransferase, putative [Ixodes scapularis]|uniref:diacylglycerol O-acyltransferase n=1 Tax=Ixodes scapularis TaxID=6945 RepID=B7QAH1_IXOSC|nr:diacylglycerol O-acyltransferase, putative [Ixodes scapularis]|eukprot:XP_002400832.1 diacylglycerol O-acyltransferase, putative [Ixodes scapularis]
MISIWECVAHGALPPTGYLGRSTSACPGLRSLLSIQWAPLRIPLHRRLETLAAFYYSASFLAFGVLASLLLVYLLFTRFCCVSVVYFAWMIWDWNSCDRGGHPSTWVRSWTIWNRIKETQPFWWSEEPLRSWTPIREATDFTSAEGKALCEKPSNMVGAPLEVAKIDDPSDEEVDALHEKYTIALSRLFEDHKDLYAAPGAQLCIA